MLRNAQFSDKMSYKYAFRCEKSRLPLKLCKLKKNRIFSHYFLREKARQFGNMPRLRIQGLDNFYIPSFASKLLLKEVICKKDRQKRLFSTESSTYRDFLHLNAYL